MCQKSVVVIWQFVFLNVAKLKTTNISEVKISFINVMICCNDTFLQCYERYLQWGGLGIGCHFVVKAVVLLLYVVAAYCCCAHGWQQWK